MCAHMFVGCCLFLNVDVDDDHNDDDVDMGSKSGNQFTFFSSK